MSKIAICSQGEKPSDLLDGRFGRCTCFMLYNEETSEYAVLTNSGKESAHGAGTGSVQELLKNNVGTVITSRVGPKAFAGLKQAGVKMYACPEGETVEEAFQKYKANQLEEISAASH